MDRGIVSQGSDIYVLGAAAYYWGMVEQTLMDKAQQLDDADKIELAYALLSTVNRAAPVSPETAALIDQRVAHAEQNPDDGILWENLRSELRQKYA